MNNTLSIGLKLRTLRKAKGLKQTEMAHKLGISQQMYSKYENEKSDPSLSKLLDMAKTLGLSIEYLLASDTIYHLKLSQKECELLVEEYPHKDSK